MKPAVSALEKRALWKDLQAALRRLAGVVLHERNAESALAILEQQAAALGVTPADYLRSLAASGRLEPWQGLIDGLVIGATWFMRESAGIQTLVEALVRDLGVGRSVRIWCAGCSTGQEPYGLAMALVEAGLKPRIVATDINQQALRIAQAARYSRRQVAALPESWRSKYTDLSQPGDAVIVSSITSLCHFAVHNLSAAHGPPAGAGGFDAVVCRNVLLYFERAAAAAVVAGLSAACRPGGYVLLSAAERPLCWMTDELRQVGSQVGAVLLQSPAVELGRSTATGSIDAAVPTVVSIEARPPSKAVASSTTAAETGQALAEASRMLAANALTESLRLVDGLLARDPLLAAAQLIRGLVLKRLGSHLEAAASLRCARFLYSDEAWLPPYHLALTLEQLGERREAGEAYRHALAVLEAGGASGLWGSDGAEQLLLTTVAETCRARMRALERSSK